MNQSNKKLPPVNENFYLTHMIKQVEIESRKELINEISFGFPPMKQRMEKDFEWERYTPR